jgi:hypothetical protein
MATYHHDYKERNELGEVSMDFNNTILDNTAERTRTIEENKFVWKLTKMLLIMLINDN